MGKVIWKAAEYERLIQAQVVDGMDAIGKEAKAFVQRGTPVLSGYARRSVFYVVLDEGGAAIGGDTTDGNGEPVPDSFPGNGRIRAIVGANAPYYIWIEIGTRGRPGKQALAAAANLINSRVMQAVAEAKQR